MSIKTLCLATICLVAMAAAQDQPATYGGVGLMVGGASGAPGGNGIFTAGGGFLSSPIPITSGPLIGMKYLRLEWEPLPNSTIGPCSVAVDNNSNGSTAWVYGGAVPVQDCTVSGSVVVGPVTRDNLRVDGNVQGLGQVRVRLVGQLSTFATAGSGTITGVLTASGSGLLGGGTSGSLNLSLLNCSSGQVEVSDGTNWNCGSGAAITLKTNGTNNGNQTLLNFLTSSANADGLVVTPSNSGGTETLEVSGTFTGTASLYCPLTGCTYTGNVSGITPTMIGLGSVTNDAQTKAAILPNTAPSMGFVPVGNSGGTAYVPRGISGDSSMNATGVMTNTGLMGAPFCPGYSPTIGNAIVYSAGSPNCYTSGANGAITLITAGAGLTGGGSSGNVTVAVANGGVTDSLAAVSSKPPAGLVATSNLTLSGQQTIDGQTGAAGNTVVLATAQSTASQNGPWVMQTGAWTRPTWYPSGGTTQAFQFITEFIRLGTLYQGTTWRQTAAAPITIDTTATTWVETPLAVNATSVANGVQGTGAVLLGSSIPLTTNGDLLTVVGGSNARVGIGSTGQILFVSGGLPAWDSALSDSGTLLSYTGAFSAAGAGSLLSLTTGNGSVAGIESLLAGTVPAGTAGAWNVVAPASITGTPIEKLPTAAYTGFRYEVNSSGTMTPTVGNLAGDVTTTNSLTTTLATVNSNVGSFTSANITVDAKGRVTAASNGSAALGYPSGTGIVQVAGGTGWGTTLTVGGAAGDVGLIGSTPAQFAWNWLPGYAMISSQAIYGPLPFATAASIPTNGTDGNGFSSFYLGTAPTATWVATIKKIPYAGSGAVPCSGSPSSIGTISVSTGNIATFTVTATSFAKGDCYEVVAPATVDGSAATPYMTQYLLK